MYALNKSVTVAIVDELERRGFAERRLSETDRRRHALYATADGQAFLDSMFDLLNETERHVMEELSPAELALLHEFLDRIHAASTRKS